MQTHSTGAIQGNRRGSLNTTQSFSLDFANNASGVDLLLFVIPATPALPIALSIRDVIGTADNAVTSSVLRLGTSAGATDLINDVDQKAAANTNYTTTNATIVFTALTPIYARITRVGASTAGQTFVLADLREINIDQPLAPGA